jgi:hypothetical protein
MTQQFLTLNRILVATAICLYHSASLAQTDEDEPFYSQLTRAVVRIEQHQSICMPGLETSLQKNGALGSAFFVEDSFEGQSRFFIVTARHIVEPAADLFVRVQLAPNSQEYAVLILPRPLWIFHPIPTPQWRFPIDVAVMQITDQPFMKAFLHCPSGGTDGECGRHEKTKRPLGNQLFGLPSVLGRTIFLGFPEGVVSKNSLDPLARSGVVAYTTSNPDFRIDGKLVPTDSIYLLDATSLPGNSGGPVLREPLPLMGGVQLWGLVTGSSPPGRSYAIVTRTEKITETLTYARTVAKINDQWSSKPPSLSLKCVAAK